MTPKDWSDDIIQNYSEGHGDFLSNAQQVGHLFQETRRKMGFQVEDVAKHLHMRTLYIEAIEKGNLDLLPGHIYRVGFIKTYARFLGLDTFDVLQKLDLAPHDARTPAFDPMPLTMTDRGIPSRGLVTFSVCVALSLGVGYVFWQRLNEPITETSEVAMNPEFKELITAIETKHTDDKTAEKKPSAAPSTAPALSVIAALANKNLPSLMQVNGTVSTTSSPIEDTKSIVLKAKTSTWIEVRKRNANGDSTVVATKIMAPGEEFSITPEEGLMLKTGNAGGTDVYIGGQNQGTLGPSGQIKRKIPLSVQELTSYLAKENGRELPKAETAAADKAKESEEDGEEDEGNDEEDDDGDEEETLTKAPVKTTPINTLVKPQSEVAPKSQIPIPQDVSSQTINKQLHSQQKAH